MAVKAISGSDKDQELIIDTLKHARRQEYTPQRLCELQKIIETQYYYWWIMDMKKEEFCLELFDEDFQYYYNAIWHQPTRRTGQDIQMGQCASGNDAYGPSALVWLMDEKNARGIFQYEDHQVYRESGEVVETWMVYCNDFCKDEKGIWHIKTMRMIKRQADGRYHDINPPEAGSQKSGIHVIFKKGDRMNLRGDIILSFTILFHIIM